MIIDTNDKKRVKELFSEWQEINAQRKELNVNSKDVKDEAAKIFEVKPKMVNTLFRIMQKQYDDGVDELEILTELSMQLED